MGSRMKPPQSKREWSVTCPSTDTQQSVGPGGTPQGTEGLAAALTEPLPIVSQQLWLTRGPR